MAAQTNYNYGTPKGVPGGKVDLSLDEVITRINEAEDGALKFGMAAAVGTAPGSNVNLPGTDTTAEKIEGVVLYHPNTEQDRNGKVVVRKNASLGIMRKGRIWGRTAADAAPVYGTKAYVVVDGDDAGTFTSASGPVSVYVRSESGVSGAKEVVADNTAYPAEGQIKISEVAPAADSYQPAIGDYVVTVQLHGATIDIGATFGNASDDGIAVVILR